MESQDDLDELVASIEQLAMLFAEFADRCEYKAMIIESQMSDKTY